MVMISGSKRSLQNDNIGEFHVEHVPYIRFQINQRERHVKSHVHNKMVAREKKMLGLHLESSCSLPFWDSWPSGARFGPTLQSSSQVFEKIMEKLNTRRDEMHHHIGASH